MNYLLKTPPLEQKILRFFAQAGEKSRKLPIATNMTQLCYLIYCSISFKCVCPEQKCEFALYELWLITDYVIL